MASFASWTSPVILHDLLLAPLICSFGIRRSSEYDRGQARSQPAGLDGGPCQPLPFQRRHRWAHVQNDPTGAAGNVGAIIAADDDRQEVWREVCVPAVLWEGRGQLFR